MKQAHAEQDAIKVEQRGGLGRFDMPARNLASQKKVRDLLIALSETLPDKNRMFGTRTEVDPVRFLLAASVWGKRRQRSRPPQRLSREERRKDCLWPEGADERSGRRLLGSKLNG